MALLDRLFGLDKLVERKIQAQTTKLSQDITNHIDDQLVKAMTPGGNQLPKGSMMRFAFNTATQNNNLSSKKKPDSSVPFDVLRKFSISHEVSRAAINYRKRQLGGLEWDIVTEDTDQTTINEVQQKQAKQFFKQIGGPSIKYRKFMARMIEDLLVLDAVSFYRQPTRGGQLFTLAPIDAATIRLILLDTGATPLPPDVAYRQVIQGKVTGEFTTDEMIYDMINPRNNSPYGLAPLESLLVVVSSSLKAGLYNLSYLTEGNIPEGFFGVPKEWTPPMIKEFQENWDAVMAGDETATAKLRFAPDGSYQPTKKPTDMAWAEFNEWLMKVTCALFDVDPKEIGFPPPHGLGGKGYSEQAANSTDKRGLLPLAQFVEELFTDIIQIDLGIEGLKFQYMGLDEERDALSDAQVKQILLNTGQRTIDELRTDDGLDALPDGSGDKPYILGTPTFIDAESMQQKQDSAQAMAERPVVAPGADEQPSKSAPSTETKADEPTDIQKSADNHIRLVTELRTFRKYALNRMKAGKGLRIFQSEVLPQVALDELNKRLQEAIDVDMVKSVFSEYMQDYQIQFLADVYELRKKLEEK